MLKTLHAITLAAGLALVAALAPAPADAQGYSDEQQLVDEAALTLHTLLNDPNLRPLRQFIKDARAVLIVPELLKGGFVLGAEGGNGVFLVRGANNTWSDPAFYTLGAGSIGLQIGFEAKEVVFTIMNDGAVMSILDDQAKLGVDLSGAIGPIGAGLEVATTTNFDQDIFAFSNGVGLFAGGAFEGAVIARRDDMNEAYYGPGANAYTITQQWLHTNPGSSGLRSILALTAMN